MKAAGYLVLYKARPIVLATNINPLYNGINRIPSYPSSHAAHEKAVWMLNFEIDKNEYNMLRTIDDAREVRHLFLEAGCTEIEMVHCKLGSIQTQDCTLENFLGIDVAVEAGDFWSIVGDMPNRSEFRQFAAALNKNGLFNAAPLAVDYLRLYKELRCADSDMKLTLYAVYTVQ
jgi:hypothetical protein